MANTENRLIPSAEVRRIVGGVSVMTLWRWLERDDLGFPKPLYITRRRYWREAEIQSWIEAQAGAVQ